MLTIKLTNTSAGLIAIQRALAGEDITFTKLDIGDGVLTNLDISNFTGVINKIKDYSLGVVKPEGQEMVRLRANINNVGITEDKAIREFGLYAKFGSSEQEFLFAYMNTGDIPTALPSSSGGRYDLNRDFVLYIGSSTNVTFDTNGDLVYSTLNDYKALEAQKEDKFPKNSAFNRDFGVNENQVLEGSKLAEILGIEYGGILNNSNQKISGKGYYDTANKKIYKCTGNTSINYADAGYFIEVSNNDLLGKLQNLYVYKSLQVVVPYEIYSNKVFQIPEGTKFLSIYMARTATTEHRDFRFIDLNFLSIATPSQSIAWITRRYDVNRYIYEDLTIKNGTIEMGTNNEVAHFIVAHI
ncbi:MAG: hypothetical protein RR476_03430 [Cetobacterium sp.]